MSELTHLAVVEKTLSNGGCWTVAGKHWTIVQLAEGIAYACSQGLNQEIPGEGVVVCSPRTAVELRSSKLRKTLLRCVAVQPGSLSGFLTALERLCLETHAPRQVGPYILLAAEHPLAMRMPRLNQKNGFNLSARLEFLTAFAELLSPHMTTLVNGGETTPRDVNQRLTEFINQMPESELAGLTLGQLAEHLHCCERHASRRFCEVMGTSFRTYVLQLRLKKACRLLAEGKMKVVDVALESGHNSLSLFNYLFKKHYYMTPTQWRERHAQRVRGAPRPAPRPRAADTVLFLLLIGLTIGFGAENPPSTSGEANQPPAAKPPAPVTFR